MDARAPTHTTSGAWKWAGPFRALRRRYSNIGLQRRVIAYAVIGLTMLVAIFAYVALDAVDESTDAILRERLILAGTVANSIDQTIVASESLVHSTARELASARRGTEPLSAHQKVMLSSLDASLADVNAGRPPELTALLDTAGRGVWRSGGGSLAERVGDPSQIFSGSDGASIEAGPGGGAILTVGAELPEESGFSYLGAIVLPSHRLLSVSNQADSVPGDYRIELVDESGRVIEDSSGERPMTESRHMEVIGNLVAQRTEGVGKHAAGNKDPEAVDHIVAYAPLETVPWGVVLEQREDAALGLPNSLRSRVIIIAAAGLTGSLALAWVTSRQVVRPLTRLTARARVIADGDFSGSIPAEGQDEIRRLAESFETMRARLEESQQELSEWSRELEERVWERTAQLEQRDRERDILLGKVISAQEEERRRIARDLHDQIGQTLTSLVMRLGTAEATITDDDERTRLELATLQESASNAVEEVRRMMSDLRPSLLDDMGLESAVRWYAETNLERAGVAVELQLPGAAVELPPNVEISVFRVFQEAITNVVKHASASHARVALTYEPDCICGEIQDDGRGFEALMIGPSAEGGWAVGLLGMNERVSLLGGRLAVESSPGRGATVKFEIPRNEGSGDA